MTMHWPQLLWLILWLPEFGFYVARHGKPKDEKYDAFYLFLCVVVQATVLYYGGFWTGGQP